MFFSAISSFPNSNPAVIQALNVLTPFLTALTPQNITTRFHNGLSVAFSLNSKGDVINSRISLPEPPLTSLDQLLKLPEEKNNRVFDVFYHLLLSESDKGAYLSLKSSPSDYDLLRKSNTYKLPEWVVYSDDYALAKDWSEALRQCGIKGSALRGVLATLSGILLLGNKNDENDMAEGASLIGIPPEIQNRYSSDELIASAYTSLIENVVGELNNFLSTFDFTSSEEDDDDDENDIVSVINIAECNPQSHKRILLKNVFDNSTGINNELKEDGVALSKSPASTLRALRSMSSSGSQSMSMNLSSIALPISDFRSKLDADVSYIANRVEPLTATTDQFAGDDGPLELATLPASSRIWNVLNIASSADAESQSSDTWSSSVVSAQIREFFLTEWAHKRKNIDFSADFGVEEFLEKFSPLLPSSVGVYELEEWARNRKQWAPSEFYCGAHRIWLSENVWRDLEVGLNNINNGPFDDNPPISRMISNPFEPSNQSNYLEPPASSSYYAPSSNYQQQQQQPLPPKQEDRGFPTNDNDNNNNRNSQYQGLLNNNEYHDDGEDNLPGGGIDGFYDEYDDDKNFNELDERAQLFAEGFPEKGGNMNRDMEHSASGKETKTNIVKMTKERRMWTTFVWILTFWIPTPLLKHVGRMRKYQVQMAWREKLVICFLIFLFNAAIIFYMIFLGNMICPNYDKVWSTKEVGTHQGDDDFYVAIHGNVYDITKFYKKQHSDLPNQETSAATMMPLAGQDLSDYFIPPLIVACPELVDDDTVELELNQTKTPFRQAMHKSGKQQPVKSTKLHKVSWYNDDFKPGIKKYYKGRVVETRDHIRKQADDKNQYMVVIDNNIYDLTNYFITKKKYDSQISDTFKKYNFLDDKVVDIIEDKNGGDVTEQFKRLDSKTRHDTMKCFKNLFDAGDIDFRKSARCQTANYILLAIAGVLTSVTVVKFLASLRFGGKKTPSPQDRFVICQIPAYTESEDALRLAVDSLTSLSYDNSRKLLFVVCDGMIVGQGNDRPTPRIVLDLFGVDEKIDPPKLPYLAIGEAENRLNYGQVYSGLYENEGNIVPYIVVVKCGRDSEHSKPGNRGKRDSQIMIMNFLNRVHYRKLMNPLELEIFHQLNNVVGVDPELYEFLFMVDADTSVSSDALTRLMAACTNDSKVIGTCGETSLQNEEQSWTTMIQVYEYFISHHLTKAFESLFGSVTCLPGCFSLYRLRSPYKCKPLIISNEVIGEYSILNIDTLHKKNLFSLGEDRYLTTLMAKHFPKMKMTFVADAFAQTAAPDQLKVLLSQRRRWINSTVHNLVELLRLQNMCGFCCVGMRGVVFIDLVG